MTLKRNSTGIDLSLLLGAHFSVAGGVSNAIDQARFLDCPVLQIFVKNANRWQGRELEESETAEFRQKREEAGIPFVAAHASYLINLASPDETLWRRSLAALVDEMNRCERLGVDCLIVHPGAHAGSGERTGLKRIATAVDEILDQTEGHSVKLLLETTAGQGSSLGYTFKHFRDVLAAIRRSEALFLCADSCHLFAAGYDLRTEAGYQATMSELEDQVGSSRLKVFHLNDSKREQGSRIDRHEHIGEGFIGDVGFSFIMNDLSLAKVPKILETPKGEDGKADEVNLNRLRRLVGKCRSTLGVEGN